MDCTGHVGPDGFANGTKFKDVINEVPSAPVRKGDFISIVSIFVGGAGKCRRLEFSIEFVLNLQSLTNRVGLWRQRESKRELKLNLGTRDLNAGIDI